MKNMQIWIIVFLFYYKMFLSKITGLNSASFWFRVNRNSSRSLIKFYFCISDWETEWMSFARSIDRYNNDNIKTWNMFYKKIQLNFVCGFNSRLCKKINKDIWILAQESYFFFLSLWVTVWQFFLIQEKRKYSAQGRPFFIYPFYLIHLTHFISCWKPGPGLHPTGPPDK